MNSRALVVLLISVLVGCGEQSGRSSQPAGTPRPAGTAVGIVAVRILPERPSPQNTLEAQVRFSGGRPERVAYQWLRNGNPMPGAIGATLRGDQLRKGDFIGVEVRIGQGEPAKSDAVVIGNTAPLVDWVEINPGRPTSSDTLEAVVSGKDRDDDQLMYAYSWAVNGEKVIGENGPSLDKRYFRRGDRVKVSVTAYDGTDWGKEVAAPGVTIRNSPPTIVSTPPERLESDLYRYAVKADDADGDSLRFSLQGNVPPGMRIDAATGVVEWKVVVPKEATTWEYEVVAQDPEGLKSIQKITLKYTPPA
jgi:hypothetical protein